MSVGSDTWKAFCILEDIQTTLKKCQRLGPDARASLLAQISQLRNAVETPLDSVLRYLTQPMQNAALRVAVELGLFNILAANPHESLSLSQLADKQNMQSVLSAVPSNENVAARRETFSNSQSTIADPDLIDRFMRVLTAMGVCEEVGPHTYKANGVTIALAQKGLASGVKTRYDTEFPSAAKLIDYFKSIGFRNPVNSTKSPFAYAFGAPKFEWLAQNPQASNDFNCFMTGRREGQTQETWMDIYPVHQNLINSAEAEASAVFCVDIGGGKGHDLDKLHNRFPILPGRLILQDLQKVTTSSVVFESMVHDFFQPQPIKGARVYHMRAVLHDWPTTECEKILSHIVAAMKPNYSRLIIREFILPDINAPLLGSCNDLLMMVLLAGMERTESQWIKLLTDVGLEVVDFWTHVRGGEGVIEAVKR